MVILIFPELSLKVIILYHICAHTHAYTHTHTHTHTHACTHTRTHRKGKLSMAILRKSVCSTFLSTSFWYIKILCYWYFSKCITVECPEVKAKETIKYVHAL